MTTEMRRLDFLDRDLEVEILDACPWCGSKTISLLATRGDGLPVMRCLECHLGFLGEVPTDLSIFYDEEYFKRSESPGQNPAFAGYEDYSRSYSPSSFRWLAMLIRSTVGPDPKTIFDLGAATGTFLEAARLEGFEPHGSELNAQAALVAMRRGASVVSGPFDPEQWDEGRFDVVTALEVLEHVRDVRNTLTGLTQLVAPGGLLVFFVPNVDDHLIEMYGDTALDFHKSYDHTFYFNPKFLYAMCEEMFGPDSLTLFVHEAKEWGQTVSAALGFLRIDNEARRPESDYIRILEDHSERNRVTDLSAHDALAIALTAAKFSEHNLADLALAHAVASGAMGADLATAKAQIHRHRGELFQAVAALEQALVDGDLTGDPIGLAVLVDCLGDLLDLMGVHGTGLAKGFEVLLGRLQSIEAQNAELNNSEDLLRMALDALEATRAERLERDESLQAELDALRDQNRDLIKETAELRVSLLHTEDAARTAKEVTAESSSLRRQLNEIYESRAWRMVTAGRAVKSWPRRLSLGSAADSESAKPQTRGHWTLSIAELEALPFLVSVIMPVYNKGNTLRETVDSVLAQTLQSVEIIIWNDGSTDPMTLQKLEEVSLLPEVQVFHAINRGVVAARNSAIALSRGRFICCLDPDDLIDPTYLEKAVAILQSGAGSSIAYPYVHSFGDVEEYWKTQDLDAALILKANHVPVCAVFDRRIFEATGGFSGEMADGYEDWEFWVHAAELGFKGKAIPEHLFHYRYSRDMGESRDALARATGAALRERIEKLHPHLARTGKPLNHDLVPDSTHPRLDLRTKSYPAGVGNPVVVTLPWFTIGGADSVVEMAINRWADQGRTVVVVTTSEVGVGMADRTEDLRQLTPYVYQLTRMMPGELWGQFMSTIIDSLDSPTVWNVGSAWLYDELPTLRSRLPGLHIVDQQFNEIGHIDANRTYSSLIDTTIAAYSDLADKLQSDGRTSPVQTLYVGIDRIKRPTKSEVEAFRRSLGIGDGQRLVVYVGRLSDEKRPQWMIDLRSELETEHATVVLIGNGPLRSVVSNASESATDLIWIEQIESVATAIAAADVVTLPSRAEGIPLVALEALALGTPVVATGVGGLPDLTGIEGVRLTDPDDFKEFVEAVRWTLTTSFENVHLPQEFRSDVMLDQLDRVLFGV